jgi:antitoxin YefM
LHPPTNDKNSRRTQKHPIYLSMPSTYSVTEAQAGLPSILREAEHKTVTITRRERVVGYILSPERYEAILETIELLANPEAMEAVRQHRAGRLRMRPASVLDRPE